MKLTRMITPCLWFDSEAEEAASFYVSIFADSGITQITRYGEAGFEYHRKPAGSVLTVAFELNGQTFTALNGGPGFRFNEAISLEVPCETQEELDYYWTRLSEGGDPSAQQCGWLKDRFGVSWQVMPHVVRDMLTDPDTTRTDRMMKVLLGMKKLDIATLRRAFDGTP